MRHRKSKTAAPRLVEFEHPWLPSPAKVRIFEDASLSRDELLLQLEGDGNHRPYIIEEQGERRLHFSRDSVQSVMSLQDPNALLAAYTRKMMAFLLYNPEPAHILMVGLGGGSLTKFCYRYLPKTRITVVEINRDVIALRDEFCIPRDDARLRIVHADAVRYLRRLRARFDVALVDAFEADDIARSLSRSDFYTQAASHLSWNGMLVMNLAGHDNERYVENIRAALLAFSGDIVLVPVRREENLVLFAHKRSMPRTITADLTSSAERLQARLQLEFPKFLRLIYQGFALHRTKGAT